MITTLRLEFFKIRRKKIGLMILLFLFVEMLWAFLALSRSIARNPDDAVWESILMNVISMNGLFMPILAAIIVSRICDMEQKGSTWKMLVATNVSRGRIYTAKYLCANSLLLLAIAAQTALIMVIGWVHDFQGPPPLDLFFPFIGGVFLTTLAITALQQWISLAVKNQAFSLCLGMVGGFIGMTAGLFPDAIRRVFIWSYYWELSPVTFRYSESTGMEYMPQTAAIGLVFSVVIAAMVLYLLGRMHITRQEI